MCIGHVLRSGAAGFLGMSALGGTGKRLWVGAPTGTAANAQAFALCDTRANTLSQHSLITAIVEGSTNAKQQALLICWSYLKNRTFSYWFVDAGFYPEARPWSDEHTANIFCVACFTLFMLSSDEQRWLILSTLSLYSTIHALFKISLPQVYENILVRFLLEICFDCDI